MQIMKGCIIAIGAVVLMLTMTMGHAIGLRNDGIPVNSVSEISQKIDKQREKDFVPQVDDMREQGYPKNEKGETYGPNVKELDDEPELILVRYEGGYGYVRKSEMDNDGVQSPSEAVEKMKGGGSREINVYLQDGITCIGTFELQGWG